MTENQDHTMSTRKQKKLKQTTSPPTQASLDEALQNMRQFVAEIDGEGFVPPRDTMDGVTLEMSRLLAKVLREDIAADLTTQIQEQLSLIRRAKAVADDEAARLLSLIKATFEQASQDAKAVSAAATLGKSQISKLARSEMLTLKQEMEQARATIAQCVADFENHIRNLDNERKQYRSIPTVLGEMRGHAETLRRVILRGLESGEHKVAHEGIKALFAFYDVNLARRFDAPGEVIYGKNLTITPDDEIILNGKKLESIKG